MAVELCISEKKWGPIYAALYVTDLNTIRVRGIYHDEERNKDYTGPEYEISGLSEELIAIKKEQPQRYLRNSKWRNFVQGLWKTVQDNPWFRYPV